MGTLQYFLCSKSVLQKTETNTENTTRAYRSVLGTAHECSSCSCRHADGARTHSRSPFHHYHTLLAWASPRSQGGTCTLPTNHLKTGHRCCRSCRPPRYRDPSELQEGADIKTSFSQKQKGLSHWRARLSSANTSQCSPLQYTGVHHKWQATLFKWLSVHFYKRCLVILRFEELLDTPG